MDENVNAKYDIIILPSRTLTSQFGLLLLVRRLENKKKNLKEEGFTSLKRNEGRILPSQGVSSSFEKFSKRF